MNQKRFPEEFKNEEVRQVVAPGHPVAELSAQLGVSTHSMYKWREGQQRCLLDSAKLPQTEELRDLKGELKLVSGDSDFLNKAAAYFAKQSG